MSKLILHNYVHTSRARAHDASRPARRVMVRDCGGDCDCSDCKDQRGRAYGNRDRTTERGWRAAVSAKGVGVIETSPLFISEQRARAWLDEQIKKLKRAGKRAWGTLRSSFEDPDRHADSVDVAQTPKSFWSYQAGSETPSLEEAVHMGAVASNTTTAQWEALSPGMRREIVRSHKKRGG